MHSSIKQVSPDFSCFHILHIAMTEERIITTATFTSGEKTDGKELPALIQKSRETGMEIKTVIRKQSVFKQRKYRCS